MFPQKISQNIDIIAEIHGSRPSWATNHYFVNLYSKYQSPCCICFSIMLAPVISSLDEINCIYDLDATISSSASHILWLIGYSTLFPSSRPGLNLLDYKSIIISIFPHYTNVIYVINDISFQSLSLFFPLPHESERTHH